MYSIKILPIFVRIITSQTIMKRFYTHLFPIFFVTLWLTFGCGEKKSERAGGDSAVGAESQAQKASPLRSAQGKIGTAVVKVQYGSPAVRNRVVWGDLLPFGEVWRTGANEATFVEFSEDVTVEGKPLKAGKYSLFTIPKEHGKWTVIFNSEWNLQHGHYQYKEENDVLRVEANPQWEEASEENLKISIEDYGLLVRWEKLSLPIHIE